MRAAADTNGNGALRRRWFPWSVCPALLAVLYLLCSCEGHASGPQSLTGCEVRAGDTLALLRADFDSLRLYRAMDRARWLNSYCSSHPDSVSREMRATVFQYLAMLHYEHARYTDSMQGYTESALELLPPDGGIHSFARQLLCQAYVAYYHWSWIEVEIFSTHAIGLLESSGVNDRLLAAALRNIQGNGRQQRGLTLGIDSDKRKEWNRALASFTAAHDLLSAPISPWRDIALENIKVLLSRYAGYDFSIPDGVPPAAEQFNYRAGYVNDHLARGKYFLIRHNADSAIYHYERLRTMGPYFRQVHHEEALFGIRQESNRSGRYDLALAASRQMFDYLNCCPDSEGDATLADCDQEVRCSFALSEHAEIILTRYLDRCDPGDLTHAYRISHRSLERYQAALMRVSEESLFNRLNTLGERLITCALSATYHRLRETAPNRGTLDTLLQTMELGRTHLLSMELAADPVVKEGAAGRGSAYQLSVLKDKYATTGELSSGERRRFVKLALSRHPETGFLHPDSDEQVTVSVAAVRKDLAAEQAFIEFDESGDAVFAIYIDADTAVAYEVPVIRDTLHATVESFLVEIAEGRSLTQGAVLYRQLLGPVQALLAGRKRLLLAPSPSLAGLPFSALTCPDQSTLIASHSVRQIDSWRTYRLNGFDWAQPKESDEVGIWVHPELAQYFKPLLEHLMGQQQVGMQLYGAVQTTGAVFLREAKRYDWLQLSVHAGCNPLVLHENYLHFSVGDSLKGRWIGEQELTARLVVLAACSGATGFSGQREGTFSLRREFQRAGVAHVVSSLYDIPAAATAIILREFYRELLAGATPEAALATAQRRCEAGSLGRRWMAPKFWAGLVLS